MQEVTPGTQDIPVGDVRCQQALKTFAVSGQA